MSPHRVEEEVTMNIVLWVVLAWLALNVLLVVIWAGVGRFASRAIDEARALFRAEVVLTALGALVMLGGVSLASPAVRQAVKSAVLSVTELGGSTPAHSGLGAGHPAQQGGGTSSLVAPPTTAGSSIGGSIPRPAPKPSGQTAQP